jgi:hypothetical protein
LPTKSQLQAESLSTAFLYPLALAFFLAEVKTFTNFIMAYHNLRSSRVMPSRLGDFTSKSNKYYEDCFTKLKYSSAHKEDLTQPYLRFLTNHTNITKRCRGELTKTYVMSIFIGGTNNIPRREGDSFILVSQKLAVVN